MLQNSERKLAFMKYMRVVCASEESEYSEEGRKKESEEEEEEEKKMAVCMQVQRAAN
jgi:hypothetical protein